MLKKKNLQVKEQILVMKIFSYAENHPLLFSCLNFTFQYV